MFTLVITITYASNASQSIGKWIGYYGKWRITIIL